MGLGAGIATSLLAKNLTLYNPTKKGSISGIVGIITVVLSAAFSFSGEKIINPTAESVNAQMVYPPDVASNTYKYFLIGFIAPPVAGILGFLFLFEYKKEDDPRQYLKDSNNKVEKELYDVDGNKLEKEEKEEKKEEEVPLEVSIKSEEELAKEKADKNFEKEVDNLKQKRHRRQAIKSWRFWRIALASLLLNFPVMFMVNTGRIFGAIIGINSLVLQLMGIFQAFGFVVIGPILGYVSDKKNPLVLLRIVSLICVVP